MNRLAIAAAAALLSAACIPEEDMLAVDELEQELVVSNGIRLNTAAQNGIRLNGIRLNTGYLNGIRLNSPSLNGVAITGVQMINNRFYSSTLGNNWVGVVLEAADAQGQVVRLRIDAVHSATGMAPWKYTVRNVATNEPVCGYDASGLPTRVVPVRGTWNYGVGVPGGGSKVASSTDYTLACSGKDAIAKCIEWGYWPWLPTYGSAYGTSTVYMDRAHQACTRAVRQDFCGDGRSATRDGNVVDVYDNFLVNRPEVAVTGYELKVDAKGRQWGGESEWTPDGAYITVHGRDNTGVGTVTAANCGNGWWQRVEEFDATGRVDGVVYTPFKSTNYGKNGIALMTNTLE